MDVSYGPGSGVVGRRVTLLDDTRYTPPRAYRPTHHDLPSRSIMIFLFALTGAFLLGTVYLYTDNTYPDGPAWAKAVRERYLLTAVPGIILGITAIIEGARLRRTWTTTGRALAVLWYLDSQGPYLARFAALRDWVRSGRSEMSQDTRQQRSALAQIEQRPLAPSLHKWRIWDERATILFDLKRYAEAIESHLIAKQGEVQELQFQGASKEDISIAEERHDYSISSIRDLTEDDS